MSTAIVVYLIIASALCSVAAHYLQWRRLFILCKPLTTLLIAGLWLQSLAPAPINWLVAIALFASLTGDICLMWPATLFIGGLASFLVAHIAFLMAFLNVSHFQLVPWFVVPLLSGAIIYLRLLWAHIVKIRFAVCIYIGALLLMSACALSLAWQYGLWSLACAAMLFIISDACLAWNQFIRAFRTAEAVVLLSYFGAQLLIVTGLMQIIYVLQ